MDMDKDKATEIALFKYQVIAALINRAAGETLTARIRRIAMQDHLHPFRGIIHICLRAGSLAAA